VKLYLFAGFLGSGKTTLILSVARALVEEHGQRVAIIENEVGTVGIDDKVMRQAGLDVRELYSGCVCCTLTADLLTALRALSAEYHPDPVILEASGLATPANVVDGLRHYREGDLEGCKTVVLLDLSRLDMLMEVVEPLITGQIAAADILALNKVDECAEGDVSRAQELARSLNDRASVVLMSARDGVNVEPVLREMLTWE
jgi:G3E family GTPase